MAPFLRAWALTVLVETPVWAILLDPVEGVGLGRAARVGAAVTAVSHPLLWWALAPGLAALTGSELSGVVLAEVVVWLGEALGAWWLLRVRPAVVLAVSALANLSSLLAGMLAASVI